jgi:uncharacterized protein YndB with AHSA1/START domain
MKRVFDAPARFVFAAHTRPEHLKRWWGGCNELSLLVCEVDLRVGGAYRIVMRMPGGPELGFRGVYREITPPLRLVNTSVFELYPDHEALVTLSLEERGAQTIMTSTTLHNSVAARDAHLASGMEKGAGDSFDRLAEVVASMDRDGEDRLARDGGLDEPLAR